MSRPYYSYQYPPPQPPPRPGSIPSPYPNPTPPPQSQYQAYPPSVPPNKPVPGAPPSPYPASPHHAPSPINPSYPPTPYNPGPAPQGFSQAPPYGADPYGQPPQGYGRPPPPAPYPQPYGGPGPQYPPQPSYAPYPSPYPPQGAPYPGGAARPPQPGPPGPQGAPYGPPGGGPPPAMRATDAQISAYRQLLIATIQEKQLQPFYPPQKLDQLIQGLANDAPGKVNKIVHEWAVPTEVAMDIIKLSLFDVVLYVDDSGSIEFEEKGVRKEQLKQIIGIIATAASTFDEDGISVRFMNSMELGDGIRNADDVHRLVARVRFSGLTPLGTNLKNKVLDPMVVGPARAGRLQKPVLVITITDGQPAGEPLDSVAQAIRYATDEVARTPLGRGAVSFQFSQVGNDPKARDFLGSLDEDPSIGGLIDCTSNFEVEQDEMSRANPPVHLTRELWCAKLMLGAIDSSYDTQDERGGSRPSGGPSGPPPPGPPPGQYGGYSQAPSYSQPGYPSPGPSYGQPSPYSPGPGYGQPPYPPSQGQPPASGYGQPYGGYGAPPPQQGPPPGGAARGYPPQGPYGQAPPPPPRY